MSRSWAEVLHRRIVTMYPPTFRKEYGHEIELVFRDLADNPAVPAWRLWLLLLSDLRHSVLREHLENLTGGRSMGSWLPDRSAIVPGVVCGCAIFAIWFLGRAFHVGALLDQGPLLNPIASLISDALLISLLLLFAPAGFFGALRTGTLGGGLWAGLVTGLIASLTVPGDYLMRHYSFSAVHEEVFSLSIAAAVCMFVAGLGAAVAVLMRKESRTRAAGRLALRLHRLANRLKPERLQAPRS
jgi:hypothetical protein